MSGDFQLPDFYQYPPYFTLQPVRETREKQLALWRELVVSWSRHHKSFLIDTATFPLFENRAISRSLPADARETIVADMLTRGMAAKVQAGAKAWVTCVLWHSASEWEKIVRSWAHDGGRRGDVMTVDELCTGADVESEEFHGMPRLLMRKVLKGLEKAGHVSLFRGGEEDDEGVKFL